jgi:hypothetical protein
MSIKSEIVEKLTLVDNCLSDRNKKHVPIFAKIRAVHLCVKHGFVIMVFMNYSMIDIKETLS